MGAEYPAGNYTLVIYSPVQYEGAEMPPVGCKEYQLFFRSTPLTDSLVSSPLDEGKAMPLTSLDEAIKSFEVIFAADKSVEEGRPVTIEELRNG